MKVSVLFLWSDEGTKAVFSGNGCQIGRNIAIGLLFNADDDQKWALATTAGAFWAILEYWRHEFWLLFTLLTVLCRKKKSGNPVAWPCYNLAVRYMPGGVVILAVWQR